MVKRLTILALLLIISTNALCEITAKAYRSDGITPLELADPCVPYKYRDIMVGTELVIVIDSNEAIDYWQGAIAVSDVDVNSGKIYGRGDELYPFDSILPAAGTVDDGAWIEKETEHDFFDLNTAFQGVSAGEWFVFDYNAIAVGDCNVSLYYAYSEPPNPPDYYLIHNLEFSHVLSRDFIDNGQVDFADFSALALWWNSGICGDCGGTDLDGNSYVDTNDLMLFCEYWLEKTR